MSRNRRTFLKSMLAGTVIPAGSLAQTPARPPEYHPAALGYRRSSHPVLNRPTGLKIKSIESFTRSHLSIVRVQTDDGSAGYGQIAPYDADLSAAVLHRKVARMALGRDPADLDMIVDQAVEANYKFPWSYVCRAVAGLDTAIWDLLGRREGKSVCELLGGKRGSVVPVYGSSMSRTIKPEEEAERLRRLRDTNGFRAFKVRIGKVTGHDQDEWPGRTEDLVPAVRKAVGDQVALLVDANSCYSPPKAISVGRLLEDNGYIHFEEPCPYWELEWTAQVAAALKIPVAGGEQDNDLAQWRRMIEMRAVDIVQPDICYIGGLSRSLRVAEMASAKKIPCVPHSANLSLVTVFSLHLCAAIPNAGDHVEFTIENDDWTRELYDPRLEVQDGQVKLPDGPGWGVKVRNDWLAAAKREVTA